MEVPSLFIAFLAGLLSFLSPCVLPLVPAYIGYLGGSVVRTGRGSAPPNRPMRPRTATNAMQAAPAGADGGMSGPPTTVASAAVASQTMGGAVAVPRSEDVERPAASARRASERPRAAAPSRWIVLTHAIVFVLGFTLVFAIIGGLIGSAPDLLLSGDPLVHRSHRRIFQYVIGVLLVGFGRQIVGF